LARKKIGKVGFVGPTGKRVGFPCTQPLVEGGGEGVSGVAPLKVEIPSRGCREGKKKKCYLQNARDEHQGGRAKKKGNTDTSNRGSENFVGGK